MPKAAPVGAKLDSALAGRLRARKVLDAAMEPQEIAQKRTDDAMAEMNAGSEAETVRKKEGPTTGLATNMKMLQNNLKPHLSAMSREAVNVKENIDDQKDPINNEGGLTYMFCRRCSVWRRSTRPRR